MNPLHRVVLDTNVLSYILRRSLLGARYKQLLLGKLGCVACVTPEELSFGAQRRNWGKDRCKALRSLIDEYEFLPGTFDIAMLSATIRAGRALVGRPLNMADAWIAATAVGHRLPLVTHDKDFEGIEGLRVVTLLDTDLEDLRFADSAFEDVSLKAAPFSFICGSTILQ